MHTLQQIIRKLQLNNKLVVLRTCGSEYQKALLRELTAEYNLVECSLPGVRLQAEQNPGLFVQGLPLPAYLANVQHVSFLLPYLLEENFPVARLIAGCTQSAALQEELPDNAFGRIAWLDLPLANSGADSLPFVPGEKYLQRIGQRQPRQDMLAAIMRGNLFAVDGKEAMAAYVRRILQQSIMELTPARDELKFFRFLCAAAGMAGGVVNYAVLSDSVDISSPTAKQWLKLLAGAGVIYLLPSIEQLAGKRLVKAPKLYFRDTGVATHLLQLRDAGALVSSLYFKGLYENYVLNLLRESYLQQGIMPDMKFYRDSNRKEVSVILRLDRVIYPMLICHGPFNVRKVGKLFAALQPYAQECGCGQGVGCVLTLGGECRELVEGIWQVNTEQL